MISVAARYNERPLHGQHFLERLWGSRKYEKLYPPMYNKWRGTWRAAEDYVIVSFSRQSDTGRLGTGENDLAPKPSGLFISTLTLC